MQVLRTRADLLASPGQELGPTEWHVLTEPAVNHLEELTRGEARLKVDPEGARAHVLAGERGPIVPGYVTLAVGEALLQRLIDLADAELRIDQAVQRVRFISPVTIGQAIRTAASVRSVSEVPGGLEALLDTRIEAEGASRPACVVEQVVRFYF